MSPNQDSSKNRELSIEFNMRMFALGSSMFMLSQVIGIVIGFLNLKLPEFTETAGVSSSVGSFLIAFIIATTVIILLVKFVKGNMLFKVMLGALIFLGSEMVFGTFFTGWVSITLALILVALRFVHPTVLMQNIVMTLSIAGIGATLGLLLPVGAVILIMMALSIYDYIAVYKTKHMVRLFQNLLMRHVPLSIVIPDSVRGMNSKVETATPGVDSKGGRKFMMLGTGDIAFPVIFAVSAVRHSLFTGVSVLFGAFFGIIVVYSMLTRSKGGAIPALPPIALCTITAFLLSLMVEWLAVIL